LAILIAEGSNIWANLTSEVWHAYWKSCMWDVQMKKSSRWLDSAIIR